MASFTTPLELRYIDGRTWEVRSPFEYHLGCLGSTERVLIPVGFVTDFASIPRVFWNIIPPIGLYGKAAVVHDWLYQRRVVTILWPDPATAIGSRLCTKLEADQALLEGMQVLGVGWVTRQIIYRGVRWGGDPTWAKYRRNDATQPERA